MKYPPLVSKEVSAQLWEHVFGPEFLHYEVYEGENFVQRYGDKQIVIVEPGEIRSKSKVVNMIGDFDTVEVIDNKFHVGDRTGRKFSSSRLMDWVLFETEIDTPEGPKTVLKLSRWIENLEQDTMAKALEDGRVAPEVLARAKELALEFFGADDDEATMRALCSSFWTAESDPLTDYENTSVLNLNITTGIDEDQTYINIDPSIVFQDKHYEPDKVMFSLRPSQDLHTNLFNFPKSARSTGLSEFGYASGFRIYPYFVSSSYNGFNLVNLSSAQLTVHAWGKDIDDDDNLTWREVANVDVELLLEADRTLNLFALDSIPDQRLLDDPYAGVIR